MRPCEQNISQLLPQLRERKIGAEELAADCAARIVERDHITRAWVHLDLEGALAQARALDRGTVQGKLHGIPVAVKDIMDTHDLPTAYGSEIYAGHQPKADCALVARLRVQGAVVLGKSVTTEFAYFRPGPTTNPRNRGHTPGGSSSGSAAAVAECMAPLGLGTQTAASLIRPASYCGVVGFKAGHGSYPLNGIKALSQSLDSLGWMTRSVADAVIVFDAVFDASLSDERPRAGFTPRIGLCRTPDWSEAEAAMRKSFETAAEILSGSGALVETIELPAAFDDMGALHKTIMAYESARCLLDEDRHHRDRLSPQLLSLLQFGAEVDFETYRRSLEVAREGRRYLQERVFAHYDVVMAPSSPGEAPAGLEATGDPVFSRMWTLLHVPAITLPSGCGPTGLPLGIQLLGPLNEEARLFSVAHWVEERLSAMVPTREPSTAAPTRV